MSDSTKDSSARIPQDYPKPASAFERWRRQAMLVTGLGVSEEERLANLQLSHLEDCEKRKERLMNSSTCFLL